MGGGSNLNGAEEKSFTKKNSGAYLTNITLDKNYKFAYIVTSNNLINGDDTYVYVSLNGVKQKGTYIQGSDGTTLSIKAVTLRNLKKGDVVSVRGLGIGTFIQ